MDSKKPNQTTCTNDRLISEGRRLLSNVLEICNSVKIKGLLLRMDFEKAFDFINYSFLLTVLENYGFDQEVNCISILLQIKNHVLQRSNTIFSF